MSQSTNLFHSGGTALLDRPSPDLDGAPEPGSGSGKDNRTALLALGGLAAVLVLGVIAYFLVFAGDATVEQPPVVKSGAGAPAAPPAEEAPVVTAPKISNKAFGRDPFKALITEPVTAVEPVATTGDTTTTGTSVGVAPVTTDTSSTGSTDSGSTDTGSTDIGSTDTGSTDTGSTGSTDTITRPTESTPHTFKVVEVAPNNKTITVKVDGEVYRKLEAGDVFAEYFKVVLISGQVNAFQYGEEKFNVIGTEKLTIA